MTQVCSAKPYYMYVHIGQSLQINEVSRHGVYVYQNPKHHMMAMLSYSQIQKLHLSCMHKHECVTQDHLKYL